MPAAKTRRAYSGGAVATQLATGISASDVTIACTDLTTWPNGASGPSLTPVCAIINAGATNAEKIYYGPRSASVMMNVERGADATAAVTHVAGEPVEHIVAAQDTDEANSHIADDTTDDHSQYVHMQHNRTVSATHTFTAPVNFTDHPNFSHIGSSMPLVVDTGAADPGVSPDQARTDHKHDIDVAGIMKFFFPVGIPFMCYQPSAPAGWLFYNGQAVSRTTYPDLFGLFGVTQGAGDGFSTFNLPDMRGRVAVVADATHPLLATGGNLTHTMATNEMPVHNHGVNDNGHAHTITDPGHTHGVDTGDDTGFRIGISHVSTYGFTTASIAQAMTLTGLNHERTNISVNNSNTGITTQTTGGTTAVSLEQPWIAVNYITYGR